MDSGKSGSEGSGTTVKRESQTNDAVNKASGGITGLSSEFRIADRITIRASSPGGGEVTLLLSGDPHEKVVSEGELAGLIEDHFWKD